MGNTWFATKRLSDHSAQLRAGWGGNLTYQLVEEYLSDTHMSTHSQGFSAALSRVPKLGRVIFKHFF